MSNREEVMPNQCMLQILNGPNSGMTFQVTNRAKIGRNPDCEVRIDESKVSRSHALLEYTPQGWILTDQNSSNGTWIQGQRITSSRRLLSGEEFLLGETKLKFTEPLLAPKETSQVSNQVVQTQFCSGCGMTVTPDMRFCQGCGSRVNDIPVLSSRQQQAPSPPVFREEAVRISPALEPRSPVAGPGSPSPVDRTPAYPPPVPPLQPRSPEIPSRPGYASEMQPERFPSPPSPALSGDFMPPDLHWAVVLILAWVTFGLGGFYWMYKEACFVRKLDPGSQAVKMFSLSLCGILGQVMLSFLVFAFRYSALLWIISNLMLLLNLAIFVVMMVTVFGMRRSLLHYYNEVDPIQLRLSPIMTFFFSVLYFQYHFSRIAAWKKTGQLSPQSGN